jgi:hypothetical protein
MALSLPYEPEEGSTAAAVGKIMKTYIAERRTRVWSDDSFQNMHAGQRMAPWWKLVRRLAVEERRYGHVAVIVEAIRQATLYRKPHLYPNGRKIAIYLLRKTIKYDTPLRTIDLHRPHV